jgi:hypothetical protein
MAVTMSRPVFSLRARSHGPLRYAVPRPVGWGDPSRSFQCARPERPRHSRRRGENCESQSDRWCGSDGLWRNRGCLGEQSRPRLVSKVSIWLGSGGPLWSHSRGVVCFSDALELLRNALQAEPSIPDACGKGHPLTPENLQMDDREVRWRCRQCGRERAAAFRARQKAAA